MMRTPENIFEGAYAYLLVTFIGIPCTFFYNLLSSIIRALGDSKDTFLFLGTGYGAQYYSRFILYIGTGLVSDGSCHCYCLFAGSFRFFFVTFICIGSLTFCGARRKNGNTSRSWRRRCFPLAFLWDCSSLLLLSAVLCCKVRIMRWVLLVWLLFTSAMRIKMFFLCPLESLGIAMATYSGQNYGAGKPERIWSGIKASTLMMVIYTAVTFLILMVGAKSFALIFVDPSEIEILEKTELFLHISVSFFPMLGLLCILRYTIQGVGYTNLAMFSGVSEMIARILVSIYAVPAFGFIAVCYGDPMAWIAADLFLIPAFIYVYRRLKRQVLTSVVA